MLECGWGPGFVKLGLGLDLYRGASLEVPVATVQLAERSGYHSVWTAEAYGADALSPLAYLAAHTRRIKLASGVAQVAARTPAATAMHAMTVDALAGGGRTIIGLGVSGPQVVEGWYGVPWGSPTATLRDYVAIMRKILAREVPVTHRGDAIRLPYDGPGALGQGKPLKSILRPAPGIQIWIAAGGPRNVALAAETADGWLPMGYGPAGGETFREPLERGLARRPGDLSPELEVFGSLTVEINDDVQGALDARKPLTAMYVGGMGSQTHNFHAEAMSRRGWSSAAERIVELWRAGRRDEAVAAVPDDYIDSQALIGPEQRIRSRWPTAVPAGLTGVIIRCDSHEGLTLMAELAGAREKRE